MSETTKFKSFSATRRLTESALMIAIAAVIELISKMMGLELPFGGTITIASMFPIVLIAYRHGVKWGLMTGFVYSLVQIVMGVKVVSAMFLPGDSQMAVWQAICVCLLDYVLAYTVLGFGGLFRNVVKNPVGGLVLGTIVALCLRYLVHIVSGAIFYGAWAEWFFTQEGFYSIGAKILERFSGASLAVVYSVFYNGLYMIPEIVITTVVAAVLGNVPQITGVKGAKKKQPANGNNVIERAISDDCGIAATAEMGKDIIGQPTITVSVTNTTQKDILAVRFYAIPFDVYGEKIDSRLGQKYLSAENTIPAGKTDGVYWQLLDKSVKTVKLYVYSVYFADGTEWGNKDATETTILKYGRPIIVEGKAE